MPAISLHFAIVICSTLTAPETILRTLRTHRVHALNVLTYREWLVCSPPEQYDLIWINEDESSLYIRDHWQKEKIRAELKETTTR